MDPIHGRPMTKISLASVVVVLVVETRTTLRRLSTLPLPSAFFLAKISAIPYGDSVKRYSTRVSIR